MTAIGQPGGIGFSENGDYVSMQGFLAVGWLVATVPDVVGLTQAAAETAITGAALVEGAVTEAYSDSVAEGLVISQNPAAGTEVGVGTAVNLVVSLGPDLDEGEGASQCECENAGEGEAEGDGECSDTLGGYLRGDADLDGGITSPDAEYVLEISLGIADPVPGVEKCRAADVDRDGCG